MNQSDPKYRIIIVEEGTTLENHYVIRKQTVQYILTGGAVFLLLCIISFILNAFGIHYFIQYRHLQSDKNELITQVKNIAQLETELNGLRTYQKKIELLLGIRTDLKLFGEVTSQDDTLLDTYMESVNLTHKLIDEKDNDTLYMTWPAHGVITNEFSIPGNHLGIDIALPTHSLVRAAESGEVIFCGVDSLFGKTIIIQHTNQITSIYGHNDSSLVSFGAQVYRGQVIALSGNTGISTAPHLHFGIKKERYIDPKPHLN